MRGAAFGSALIASRAWFKSLIETQCFYRAFVERNSRIKCLLISCPINNSDSVPWMNFFLCSYGKFQPGRRGWDRINTTKLVEYKLKSLASSASHVDTLKILRRKEWRGEISESEPARLTELIWRGLYSGTKLGLSNPGNFTFCHDYFFVIMWHCHMITNREFYWLYFDETVL